MVVVMLEKLKILNGELSIEFDPLNSKYTVFLNENDNQLDIEYKLKSDTNITIEGNYNLVDGSIVIINVTDGKRTIDYYFNVYISKTEEVNKSIVNGTILEVDSKKEISEYAGPGIACLCFVLILFLFVFLFHKRKAK